MFTSLVLCKLDYCTAIWSPYTKTNINQLEGVQRKFLKRLHYLQNLEYPPQGYLYENLLLELNVTSIKHHHDQLSIKHLHKIIHNGFDVPDLVNLISYYVPPVQTRNFLTFIYNTTNTEHHRNSPILKMYHCYHANQEAIDIFCNKLF